MTELEDYQDYIQRSHNAFCKIVIRHAAIDIALRLRKQWEKELSLEYLMFEKFCTIQHHRRIFQGAGTLRGIPVYRLRADRYPL